ncbi:MAG TPA: FAD-dependent oxidoreductase [Vicinamibacterales bacterium]|nr:FAD-dependent oxidoreductase [Vicinamibacterales bacterium]
MSVDGLIEEGEAFRRLHHAARRTRVDVLVIGGGQAGLSVGYHLKQHGLSFVIVDAQERIGGAWRSRWHSLRLFTPARYDGLDGLAFPAPPHHFPTKDEMADYLERYAAHFQLPVRTGVTVNRLWREGATYLADAGAFEFEARHVVVAMSSYQGSKVPAFARHLSPDIVQLHSADYQSLAQLQPGPVLIVGTANSGAELAAETAPAHPTWIAGRDVGEIPFPVANVWVQRIVLPILFRIVFHRILTVDTPMGRKARARRQGALIRIRQRRAGLARSGVRWTGRVVGVRNGRPLLADGHTLDVRNVIWCTGYDLGLSWIDLPVFEADGEPRHTSGLVAGEPGLYFVGQHFQHSVSSTMIHGVGRDAARIVDAIRSRSPLPARSAS